MKLFFDARYIRTDFHDGISRYTTELGNAVARQTPVTFLICEEAQKKLLPPDAKTILMHAPTSAKEPLSARVLNKYKPDVVYSPMQTLGPTGRTYKLILTVHDLIYYRHRTPPRQLKAPIRAGWRLYHASYAPQRAVLNSADIVATVSNTSKKEIEAARLTTNPIVVLPNAPQNLGRFLDKLPELQETPRNLIYMGSFMPYKNVETLIRGMEYLPEYTLHLLSRVTPKRKEQLMKLVPKGATVVFHNGVSDEEYARLLADNALLVHASLDEGYGIPLAEALEIGVPVVVSDLEIFREVAGSGGLYFSPKDPADFAKKVRQTEDSKTRAKLIKNGVAHMQQYSWDTSAEILVDTARKLVS